MGFFDWVSKEVEEAKKRISSSFNQNAKQMQAVIKQHKEDIIKKVEKKQPTISSTKPSTSIQPSTQPTASSASLTTKIKEQIKKGFEENVKRMEKEISKKTKKTKTVSKPSGRTTVEEIKKSISIASEHAKKYGKPGSEISPVGLLPGETEKYEKKGAAIIRKKEVPKSTNPNVKLEDVRLLGKNKLGGYRISINGKVQTVPSSVAEQYFGKGLSEKEVVIKKHQLDVKTTEDKMIIKKPKGVMISPDLVKEINKFRDEGYNVDVKTSKDGSEITWVITPKKQEYKDVLSLEEKGNKVIVKHNFYDKSGKLLNTSQQSFDKTFANLYLHDTLLKNGYVYKDGKWVKTIYAKPKFKKGETKITSYVEGYYPTVQGEPSPLNIALIPTTPEGIAWGELKNRWNLSDEEVKKLKKEYVEYSKKHPPNTALSYLLRRLKGQGETQAKGEGLIRPSIESMLESKGYTEELAWRDIKKKYNLSDNELKKFKEFYKNWEAKAGAMSISTLKTGYGLGQVFNWVVKRAVGKGPLEARVEAFTEPHLSEVVEAAKKPKIQYVGETALQTGMSSSAVLLPMLAAGGGVAGTIGKVTLRAMQGYSVVNAIRNPTDENIATAILFLAPDVVVKAMPKIRSIVRGKEVEKVTLKPKTILSKEIRTRYGNKVLSLGTMEIKTNKGPKIKANLYQRLVKLKDGTVRKEWLIEIPKQKVKIKGKTYEIPYTVKRFKSQEFIKSGIKYTIEQPAKISKPPVEMSIGEKLNIVMKGEIKPSKISTPPSLKYTITQEKTVSPTKEFLKISEGKPKGKSYIEVKTQAGVESPAKIEFKKGSTPISIEKGTLSVRKGAIGRKYAKGEPPRDLINFREANIKSGRIEFVFGKSRAGRSTTGYGAVAREVSPESFFNFAGKGGKIKTGRSIDFFKGERKAFTKMGKKPIVKTTKEKTISPKDLFKTETVKAKPSETKAIIKTKGRMKESSIFRSNADYLLKLTETSIGARPSIQMGNLGRIFGGFGSFIQAGLGAKTVIGPHAGKRISVPKIKMEKATSGISLLKMEQPTKQIKSLSKPLLAPDLFNISATPQEEEITTSKIQRRIFINKEKTVQETKEKFENDIKPIEIKPFFNIKTGIGAPLVPILGGKIRFGETKKRTKLKGGRLKRKFIKPEELLGAEFPSRQISPYGFFKINKEKLKKSKEKKKFGNRRRIGGGERRKRIVFNI